MVIDIFNNIIEKDIERNKTILENLFNLDIPVNQVIVFVNNRVVPEKDYGEYIISEEDKVVIKVIPGNEAGDIFKTILAVAVGGFVANALFGTIGGYAGTALRSATTFYVSSKVSARLISPPSPISTSDSIDPRNPTISATRNKTNPYGIVPTLLGKMKIFPYKVGEFTELVGKDIYLNTLFCLGYGRIDISDIKIGETDIDSFNDVTYVPIEEKDSDYSFNYFNKDVFEETVGTQITDSAYVERTTQDNTNQISIDIEFPEGLVTFRNDGSKTARTAEFYLDYKLSSSGTWIPFQNSVNLQLSEGVQKFDAEVTSCGSDSMAIYPETGDNTKGYILNWFDIYLQYAPFNVSDTITISGSTSNDGTYTVLSARKLVKVNGSKYAIYVQKTAGTITNEFYSPFTVSKTVSQTPYFAITDTFASATRKNIKFTTGKIGQYDIRIKRKNAESTDSLIKDKAVLSTLRSIEDTGKDIAPNGLAYIEMRIKATDQLNGVIDTLNCMAESYLPVYNFLTETWTDTLIDQTSDSNLVWAYMQILRGVGNKKPVPDERIDFDTFEEWDDYCTDKEFNFNAYIDGERSVVEILKDIASAGRSNPMIKNGLQSVALDNEQDEPLQLFNERNIRNFNVNRQVNKELEGFKVKFINAEKDYQTDEFFCPNTVDEDNNIEELNLPGVTNYDHAYKIAYYLLAVEQLRPILYTFETDLQYLLSNKGDRIAYNYDVLNPGSKPRRIKAVNTSGTSVTSIEIDDNFVMESGKNYAVQYRTDNGAELSIRTESINTVAGNNTTLTFATAIPDTDPQPKIGDMILVGESEAVSRDLIITEITPQKNGAEIKCVDYSADIYNVDDPGFVIPPFTSKITFEAKKVLGIPNNPIISNIISDERALIFGAGGSLISRIIFQIDYNGQVDITSYQIQHRLNGSNSQYENQIISVDEAQGVISPVTDTETYEVRVRALTRAGQTSDWVTFTETVSGKTNPPADVTGFSAVVERENIKFSWTKNSELDISGYEIRKGTVWSTASVVGFYDTNIAVVNDGVSGTGLLTFLIKAVDTTGNYSENAVSDTVVVLAPANPVLIPTVVQNNVVIDWQNCKTTFPIQRSIIKKSLSTESYSEAETLNENAPESFYNYIESVGGTYKYYVQVEDTAENLSDVVSITQTVGNPANLKYFASYEDTDFTGTLTNAFKDNNGKLLMGVDTAETYAEHFTDNSFDDFQDFVDNSFTSYAEPAETSASYSITYDIGATLNTGKILTMAETEAVKGSPVLSYVIGLSTDGITFTNYSSNEVFSSVAFRYINITVNYTGATNKELIYITSLKTSVQLTKRDESSELPLSVVSAGQTVTFNETFRRVYDINVNPLVSTVPYICIAYDFDVDNPTSFKIKIFDKDGNTFGDVGFPSSIDVTWTARGVTDL